MSKLIALILLLAFVIPAGVFAAPAGTSCTNCGMANETPGANAIGAGCSCGSGAGCDCGAGCTCGVNGKSCGSGETCSCGMMGGDRGVASSGTCTCGIIRGDGVTTAGPGYGMMGGWGPGSAMGTGMYGWAAGGFVLVIILIIIWIIVGILLIINLYRKLSAT